MEKRREQGKLGRLGKGRDELLNEPRKGNNLKVRGAAFGANEMNIGGLMVIPRAKGLDQRDGKEGRKEMNIVHGLSKLGRLKTILKNIPECSLTGANTF